MQNAELPRVPISAPGSTLEDLENDRAALESILDAVQFTRRYHSGWRHGGNLFDPEAVEAWVRDRLQETENSINARVGGMPDAVDVLASPFPSIETTTHAEQSRDVALRLRAIRSHIEDLQTAGHVWPEMAEELRNIGDTLTAAIDATEDGGSDA